jgi:hypothetical protein
MTCSQPSFLPVYTAGVAVPPKPYRFSTYVGNLCVTRDTNVHKLAAAWARIPLGRPGDIGKCQHLTVNMTMT